MDYLKELRGIRCRCGASKNSRQTFCRECYYALPQFLRARLYDLIGDGYEQAYDKAAAWLDAEKAKRP